MDRSSHLTPRWRETDSNRWSHRGERQRFQRRSQRPSRALIRETINRLRLRDPEFESALLQRGVCCEPQFRGAFRSRRLEKRVLPVLIYPFGSKARTDGHALSEWAATESAPSLSVLGRKLLFQVVQGALCLFGIDPPALDRSLARFERSRELFIGQIG